MQHATLPRRCAIPSAGDGGCLGVSSLWHKTLTPSRESVRFCTPPALRRSTTGCNGFFYVAWLGQAASRSARIRLSHLFDDQELTVPAACLAPVVRRQSELSGPVAAARLTGRVLDLREWVLPEDADIVEQAKRLYHREGRAIPSVMPLELANFVRRAGNTLVRTNGSDSKPVAELSAVRTNVRAAGEERIPRFWYMLPSFAERHLPHAFVARINQGVPWIEVNDDPPALIDAKLLDHMWRLAVDTLCVAGTLQQFVVSRLHGGAGNAARWWRTQTGSDSTQSLTNSRNGLLGFGHSG
jgi:hypothetical protein